MASVPSWSLVFEQFARAAEAGETSILHACPTGEWPAFHHHDMMVWEAARYVEQCGEKTHDTQLQ
jgi:hypothetical protein